MDHLKLKITKKLKFLFFLTALYHLPIFTSDTLTPKGRILEVIESFQQTAENKNMKEKIYLKFSDDDIKDLTKQLSDWIESNNDASGLKITGRATDIVYNKFEERLPKDLYDESKDSEVDISKFGY